MPRRRLHARRYQQIVRTLFRHGFGYLVNQLGIARFVPFHYGILGHLKKAEPYTQPEHVRLAFEDLSTTYIKLGQILSTRPDIIPPEYLGELEKLQDRVPPVSPEIIKERISQELGAPLNEIFADFNDTPLASASIGQVHAATLKTGEPVVVKVQRPGVHKLVETDIDILARAADFVSRRVPSLQMYDLPGVVQEFAYTIRTEMDYHREGQNAERFRRNFEGDPAIYIPRVYWDYTASRVLTLERLEGPKISDLEAFGEKGLDRRRVARRSTHIILKEVFEHGFFHADPHPANFVVLENEVIGVMDFGMVGYLDEETRQDLTRLFVAVSEQDAETVVEQFLELGAAGGDINLAAFKNEICHLLIQYQSVALKEMDLRVVLDEMMAISRRHRLRMPSNLALLIKTVGMEEGLVRRLDPDFRLIEMFEPYARKIWLKTFGPSAWRKQLARGAVDLVSFATGLPRQIRRITGQVSRGDIRVVIKQPRLDEELSQLNAMFNRLSLSILISAFFVVLGLLMLIYHPVGVERLVAPFLIVGLIGATAFGLWLLVSILRSGLR